MAKVKVASRGEAFERWCDEAERLDAAHVAARAAYSRALFAMERATKRCEAHERFRSDPVGWASGEVLGGPEDKFRAVKCAKCGWEGVTPGGECGRCAAGSDFEVLSIYQSV